MQMGRRHRRPAGSRCTGGGRSGGHRL